MDGQDDLDELLDEIEESHIPHLSNSKITKSSNSKSITSDIDNMIDELLSEDDKDSTDNHNIKSSWQQVSSVDNKCYPVLLGGSDVGMGHCHSSVQRACNTLRCTSCDFRVIWFNDYCWHSSCDYLFFRNNVPEYDKHDEQSVHGPLQLL